jgi:hypothetical protein
MSQKAPSSIQPASLGSPSDLVPIVVSLFHDVFNIASQNSSSISSSIVTFDTLNDFSTLQSSDFLQKSSVQPPLPMSTQSQFPSPFFLTNANTSIMPTCKSCKVPAD